MRDRSRLRDSCAALPPIQGLVPISSSIPFKKRCSEAVKWKFHALFAGSSRQFIAGCFTFRRPDSSTGLPCRRSHRQRRFAVSSPRGGAEALPLRTIIRLEEGDLLIYRPLLRSGEDRKGEVTLGSVPANPSGVGEKLRILDPKPASEEQKWSVPFRVAVVGYIYGPSGLSIRRVRNFLAPRNEDLIAQLADYAEKTAQTEALISALATPGSSADAVQSALQGFSSQYGLNVQLDKNAPANQQAMVLFRALNPAIAQYDPIAPQGGQQFANRQSRDICCDFVLRQSSRPRRRRAAMLMEMRALAFPKSDFRSSFSQALPNDGLALCGLRDRAAAHTKVAYLWASRVPNVGPPQIAVEKAGIASGRAEIAAAGHRRIR